MQVQAAYAFDCAVLPIRAQEVVAAAVSVVPTFATATMEIHAKRVSFVGMSVRALAHVHLEHVHKTPNVVEIESVRKTSAKTSPNVQKMQIADLAKCVETKRVLCDLPNQKKSLLYKKNLL